MKLNFLFLYFLLCASTCVYAALTEYSTANLQCLNDVCFEKRRQIASDTLPLKGIGLYEFFKFDLYAAAFYAPEALSPNDDLLAANVPRSLVLDYRKSIKSKYMKRAAKSILKKNPEIDMTALAERLEKISEAYQNVKKGDRYELRYVPGKGTSLFLNRIHQVTILGEDFARAYFGIWLSEYAGNSKLRDRLLAKN